MSQQIEEAVVDMGSRGSERHYVVCVCEYIELRVSLPVCHK